MTDIFLTEFILLQKEFSPDLEKDFILFFKIQFLKMIRHFHGRNIFFMSFCKRNFFRFFIFNDLYCRRKFFCSTPLQKDFFLYMKKQSLIMINIFSKRFPPYSSLNIYFTEEYSFDQYLYRRINSPIY